MCRIALCHEWAVTWSGSEQVAGRIAEALDVDDVFVFTADPRIAGRAFGDRPVQMPPIGRSGLARRQWRWLLPFMVRWWRDLDLSSYDVVVTSSHAAVNSVRPRPDAVHVSYCHTPMRYAWLWRSELGRLPAPLRPLWPAMAALLRRGDRRRARDVDLFVANSHHVAGRIERFYGRPSVVVHPPVRTDVFTPDADGESEDFFLYAGRLVAYKRPDVAVEAAERAGVPLVVAGSGPELGRLKRLAGPSVSFVEAPSDTELRDLYRRARALVYPGVEDFGMTMVEAQACGTPVVAYREGGASEAVRDGETGLLYDDPAPEGLAAALRGFSRERFDPRVLRAHAEGFAPERFDAAIREIVERLADAPAEERPTVVRELTGD